MWGALPPLSHVYTWRRVQHRHKIVLIFTNYKKNFSIIDLCLGHNLSFCGRSARICWYVSGNWSSTHQCRIGLTNSCIKHFVCVESNTGRFIMFSVITNIYNKKTKGRKLMELFTATGKLKKFFFWQLQMFDVCTTGDTAHIDAIFNFLPHTQHGCIDSLHCCNDPYLRTYHHCLLTSLT
jgi:hypothetical protein